MLNWVQARLGHWGKSRVVLGCAQHSLLGRGTFGSGSSFHQIYLWTLVQSAFPQPWPVPCSPNQGGPALIVPSPHWTHLLPRRFSCDSRAGFLSRPALERVLAASASSMSECWSPMWEPSTQQKFFSRTASQYISAPELWTQIFWRCRMLFTLMCIFSLNLTQVCIQSVERMAAGRQPRRKNKASQTLMRSVIRLHKLKSKCHSKRLKSSFQSKIIIFIIKTKLGKNITWFWLFHSAVLRVDGRESLILFYLFYSKVAIKCKKKKKKLISALLFYFTLSS